MNYIDVKEACEKTNKSEKTIRRLFLKEESKPFIQKIGNKNLIEVNYLFSVYEPTRPNFILENCPIIQSGISS